MTEGMSPRAKATLAAKSVAFTVMTVAIRGFDTGRLVAFRVGSQRRRASSVSVWDATPVCGLFDVRLLSRRNKTACV
jgi:hypothetical protein